MKNSAVCFSVLALAALAAGTAGAANAPAGAVVGWWKFDDATNPGKDSSIYGNDLVTFQSNVSRTTDTANGTYDGSGCLYFGTAGQTASTVASPTTWNTSSGYTYMIRLRSQVSVSSGGDTQVANLISMLNDNNGWHLLSMRYDNQKVTGGTNKYYYWLMGDDPTVTADDRKEASADSDIFFPLSAAIAIGGKAGAKVGSFVKIERSAQFKGYMDDVIVVARTMTKTEIQRYYKTNDPNPYLKADNDISFAASSGWSCGEEGLSYSPVNLPGADFQVDNGRQIRAKAAHEGTTFGGHSLILGRITPLLSRLDSSTVASVNGNFVQQASVTIPELVFNRGTLTASASKTLTATKLVVNATQSNPYEVNVASGTYTMTGTTQGTGFISKTGAGTLDASGLSGTAKVRLTAGEIKTARLDGYTGGTLVVDAPNSVEFTGSDTKSGAISVRYTPQLTAEGTVKVLTVPNSYTASDVSVQASCDSTHTYRTEVVNGAVNLVCEVKQAEIPDVDKGSRKPVMIFD